MDQRDKDSDVRKLARAFFDALRIDDVEFGGIGLDPKRPFGNSYAEGDILEIIGWEPEEPEDDYMVYSERQEDYAYELYHEHLIPFLKGLAKDSI